MAEVYLKKAPNGTLVPDDEDSIAHVAKFKVGQPVRCTLVRQRNYPFHQKWFTLAKYAFDIWVETVPRLEYRGQEVEANFDRFRRDLIIQAGYYDAVFNMRGELRVEAKSISFASMAEDEFEKLYSATINAVLKHILNRTNMTADELRRHVDRVIAYA